MERDIEPICIGLESTLQNVLERINEKGLGIVLVVDEQRFLLGTITDGDVRRALLSRLELTTTISVLLENKAGTRYSKPLTAFAGRHPTDYVKLLKEHQILHLPLLDQRGRVVGLVTLDDFVVDPLPLQAVVMAGGKGSRLYPLTEDLPKPMLPVGQKPLLEIIIAQLQAAGIRRVNVTSHHKREKIFDHFGDGGSFGVDLSYIAEDEPLGTAGALSLMESPRETLLVINGDILTQVDFKSMLLFHREHQADLTVAVRQYDFKVPYGIVESEGALVKCLKEKPVFKFFVNAGIYLLEPVVYDFLPRKQHLDMTDLIEILLKGKRRVVNFPVHEAWLDIGNHAEYQLAQQNIHKYHLRENK